MKIKIIRNTVCNGDNVAKGEEIEASKSDAKFLVHRGFAEHVVAPAKPAAKPAKPAVAPAPASTKE